jgi:hypothetical protein
MKVKMAARPVMISCFLKFQISETKMVMESLHGKNAIYVTLTFDLENQ